MKKRFYIDPKMEVILNLDEDIITGSVTGILFQDSGDGDFVGWGDV